MVLLYILITKMVLIFGLVTKMVELEVLSGKFEVEESIRWNHYLQINFDVLYNYGTE